jgi:hypothetical protein
MYFVWISVQTAIISVYSINLSVFITEAERVYSAVRTGSLNRTDRVSPLTLSSPMMPFGIILLIQFFICYNFGGLERVNPKICSIFLGWKELTLSSLKICSI